MLSLLRPLIGSNSSEPPVPGSSDPNTPSTPEVEPGWSIVNDSVPPPFTSDSQPPSESTESEPPILPAYTRSTVVWFEDGTVILEAGNHLFRVFSGILRQRSSVLRDLLPTGSPSTSPERRSDIYEGCPLVHLTDTATDLTHFLRAIHDARYAIPLWCLQSSKFLIWENEHFTWLHDSFYVDVHAIENFNIVAGVLKLSTKYDVPNLRRRSITALAPIYPSTLSDWDCPWQQKSLLHRNSFRGRSIAVVNLARQCDVSILLPAAIFTCCMSDVGLILDGAKTPDGSGIPRQELDWNDKRLCLSIRNTLELRARKRTFAFLFRPDSIASFNSNAKCDSPARCNSVRLQTIAQLEDFFEKRGKFWDPLYPKFTWALYKTLFCPACLMASKASYDYERAQLWEDLPGIFGLGTWDDLKAEGNSGFLN